MIGAILEFLGGAAEELGLSELLATLEGAIVEFASSIAEMIFGVISANAAAQMIARIAKREVAWEVAYNMFSKWIESLTLEDITAAILGVETEQVVNEFASKEGFRRAKNFVQLIKRINIRAAETIYRAYTIDRDLGNATQQIINSVLWAFGLGWLSWAALADIVEAFVSRELRYDVNSVARNMRESVSQKGQLFKVGLISEEEFRNFLRSEGYNDEAINTIINYYKDHVTIAQLGSLYKRGMIDEATFIKFLRARHLDDLTIALLDKYYSATEHREERNLTVSQILKARELSLIDDNKAMQLLKLLGYSEDEAQLILDTLKLKLEIKEEEEKKRQEEEAKRKIKEVSYSIVHQLYKRGAIDRDTAINLLKKLNYSDEAINYILKLWDLEREEYLEKLKEKATREQREERKKIKLLSKTDVLKLLHLGIITREQAVEMLEKLGYTEEEAALLVQTVSVKTETQA